MLIRQALMSLVVAAFVSPICFAQPHVLTETPQTGDCRQIRLDLQLKGQIRVASGDAPKTIPLSATATHEFSEKTLASGNSAIAKAARHYDQARAVISVGSERNEKSLRPQCRLQVAQRETDQLTVFCPSCSLTRAELELTSEHFDTLAVIGLLPDKPVNVGDSWKVSNHAIQALCNFEGLTQQDISCKLDSVQGSVASFSITGSAEGIDTGAFVKSTLTGSGRFDLEKKYLAALTWQQKDEREQGPASPATRIESTTTLTRRPIETPSALSEIALISVPEGFDVPGSMLQLYHRDPQGRFELMFPREWQTVAQNDRHFILRLIDRGDFVCQATISPWSKAQPGQHLSAKDFEQAMAATPGWEQEQILQSGEVPAERGRWIYRMSAVGRMDGLKVMQTFYLVAGPQGDQAVVVFTMTEAQAEKLGTRDLSLVGSLEFPSK